MPRKVANSDRFWKHVRKTRGCWYWTAGLDKDGYGKFNLTLARLPGQRPRTKTPQKYVRAYRYAFKLATGRWPKGYGILHHCDTRNCVRVHREHVREGTHRRNIRMCLARGHRPHQRLTPKTVKEVRALKGSADALDVAREYGVSRATVYQVWKRGTWRWVR